MPRKTPATGANPAESVAVAVATAAVCHQSAGRFRVRCRERRGDEAYFARAKQALEQHASVLEVATNPTTGSILVLHRGDCSELLNHAEGAGLFRCQTPRDTTQTIVHWLDRLDRFDAEVLWARMDQNPQRAATGLFMLAVLQALRGGILPSAPTLLGEAMRLLRKHRDEGERQDDGES
jgi:hypothetical protein